MLKLTNRRRAAALLIGPLMLIATACGGSTDSEQSADEGVASLSDGASDGVTPVDGTSDEAAVDELEAPENPEDAFALFNECMEEHGLGGAITVIGGVGGESGTVQIEDVEAEQLDPQAGGSIEDFDPEMFDAANEACEGHLANLDGGFDLTPEQEAAFEDAQLEFADCMAEQGIEMPEFDSATGGIVVTEVIEGAEIDPQSGGLSPEDLGFDFEAFEEAASACDSVFEQFEELNP